MEAYCVKCKTKREIQNPQPLFNSRGSPYTKGTCPVCGTNMMRLGMSELHAGMEKPQKPVDSGQGIVDSGQPVVSGQGSVDSGQPVDSGRNAESGTRKTESGKQKA